MTLDLSDPAAVEAFLRRHGLASGRLGEVRTLPGGVSSLAVRVNAGGSDVVVKQARARLAVKGDWRADVGRSLTEARCGELLHRLLPGSVPAVLAIDPDNNAFAMECAPEGSHTWKEELLAGRADPAVAGQVGELLGRVHRSSHERPELAAVLADRRHFEDLRVDPFLREVQRRHPDLALRLEPAVEAVRAPGRCLVHGDFSPKNLLVTPERSVLLIDHEVAHWGEPSFDVAFLLSHLCLKAFALPGAAGAVLAGAHAVLAAYRAAAGTAGAADQGTGLLLGALLLARIDGKSPVEYLGDPARESVRQLARGLVTEPARTGAVLDRVAAAVQGGTR